MVRMAAGSAVAGWRVDMAALAHAIPLARVRLLRAVLRSATLHEPAYIREHRRLIERWFRYLARRQQEAVRERMRDCDSRRPTKSNPKT